MDEPPQIVGGAHRALLKSLLQNFVSFGWEFTGPLPIRDSRTVLAAGKHHDGRVAAKLGNDFINGLKFDHEAKLFQNL